MYLARKMCVYCFKKLYNRRFYIQKIARRQNKYFDGELFFVWLSLWDNHAKNCGLMKYAVFHQSGVIYVGPSLREGPTQKIEFHYQFKQKRIINIYLSLKNEHNNSNQINQIRMGIH